LFAAAVIAAPGLERLLCDARRRWGRGAALFAWVLVALVAADLWLESRTWQRAATGPAIATRDHRPRPLVVEAPGARAELVEFAPNRLRYRVDASRPTRVVLPLRFGKRGCEWQTGDWRPFDRAGRVGLEVPQGRSEVTLRYRPPGLVAGALASAVSLAGLALLAARRRWGR
jgi:hypothetical protein